MSVTVKTSCTTNNKKNQKKKKLHSSMTAIIPQRSRQGSVFTTVGLERQSVDDIDICPGCDNIIKYKVVHPTFGVTNYHPGCLRRSH